MQSRRRRFFRVLWLFWLGLFAAIEGVAVFDRRRGDTLTEAVRRWAAMETPAGRKPVAWRVRRALLVGFLGWLLVHFLSNPAPIEGRSPGDPVV